MLSKRTIFLHVLFVYTVIHQVIFLYECMIYMCEYGCTHALHTGGGGVRGQLLAISPVLPYFGVKSPWYTLLNCMPQAS